MRNARKKSLFFLVGLGLALWLIFWLSGCARVPVQHDLPVREVRVWVLTDGYAPSDVLASIDRASEEWQDLGIRFRVVHIEAMELNGFQMGSALKDFAGKVWDHRPEFDIAIGFRKLTSGEIAFRVAGYIIGWGDWSGVIDQQYRRFIVVKSLSRNVLNHELAHAFVVNEDHESMPGILLPGFNPLTASVRESVIKNRNRNFN